MMPRYQHAISRLRSQPSGRYTHQVSGLQQTMDNGIPSIPQHGSYGNLLFDQRWKSKRAEIMLRDGYRCVICKDQTELQVHHRQYHFIRSANAFRMPWAYPDYLLITLCKSCHQRGHSKFKVPTLAI